MGLGHVPAGPIRETGEGDDVPRRQHRGTGTHLAHLARDPRRRLGDFGESIALRVLTDHGARLLDRNIAVGRGEIDLLVSFGSTVVAVEVKTLAVDDPTDVDVLRSYDEAKADQVHGLARKLRPRPHRIDVVGVLVHPQGVDLRWVRSA